jgi:transposase
MPCRRAVRRGWLPNDWAVSRVLVAAWLETGSGHRTHIRAARRDTTHDDIERQELMFIIGVDPHRGSHVAVVLDDHEQIQDQLMVTANRLQQRRLLEWASRFEPHVWAIEGASGTGALLAQQLVAAGERVLDVPPALAARVRLLDNEQRSKTDRHDARSVAVAARRKRSLRAVAPEDHVAVLRLLAKRHHELVAGRTRAVCRLHSTLCYLAEGHFPKRLRADQAAAILSRIHASNEIARHRKAVAREHLAEVRRFDTALAELDTRIRNAVAASGSSVTAVHGVGPIMAAYLIGYTGDIRRFPSAGHYARYNGTAPIDASSGNHIRHRLNPDGNRQLNHALYIAALGQISHDTPGRDYYLRKQAEGHTRKEALRSLKRRIRRRLPTDAF